MRKLRVVTLVDSLPPAGGAERLAFEVGIRLHPERFESTICVTRSPAKYAASQARARERALAAGVKLLELERGGTADLAAWRPLWSLLRRDEVDVLHAHMFGSNLWGTAIGRMAGVPVVVAHEHTWSFEGQPLRRFLDRTVIARFTDAFLAVSREDRRKMIELEGIDPADVLFVPNGMPPTLPATGRDVRVELGIPAGAPVLAAIGVLRAQKALPVLLRAVAALARDFEGLRLLLVGDGPERGRLEALVKELGLERTVMLTGVRSDIADILEATDVTVLSSDFEGAPLALLEYMDAAKPIVATRVGGVPDLITDGVHGLLVPPRDVDGLGRAVAELLRDRSRAAELGTRAQERRRAEFGLEAMVARLERLYEDLHRAKLASGSRYRPLRDPGSHVRAPAAPVGR